MNYKKLIIYFIFFAFYQSNYIISSESSSSSSSSSSSTKKSTSGSFFDPGISRDDRKRTIEHQSEIIERDKKKQKRDSEDKFVTQVKEKEFVTFVKKKNYISRFIDVIDIQKLIALYADEFYELKIANKIGFPFTIYGNYLYAASVANNNIFKVFDLKNIKQKAECIGEVKTKALKAADFYIDHNNNSLIKKTKSVAVTELHVYGNYLIGQAHQKTIIVNMKSMENYEFEEDCQPTALLIFNNYLILSLEENSIEIWDLDKLIDNINNNRENIFDDIIVFKDIEDDKAIEYMTLYKNYLITGSAFGIMEIWNLENLKENLKNEKNILVNTFNQPTIPSYINNKQSKDYDDVLCKIQESEAITGLIAHQQYLFSAHKNGNIKVWDLSEIAKNKVNFIGVYNIGLDINSLKIYEQNLIIKTLEGNLVRWSIDDLLKGSNKMDLISSNVLQMEVFKNYLITAKKGSITYWTRRYHDLLQTIS